MHELRPVAETVFGGYTYTNEATNYSCDKCLLWTDYAPRGVVIKQRKYWIAFYRDVEGGYLHYPGEGDGHGNATSL